MKQLLIGQLNQSCSWSSNKMNMNKICFFLFSGLSILVLILNFSRIILDFDVLQYFDMSNHMLLYLRKLSLPSKLFLLIAATVIIIFLLRGFLSYLKYLHK